MNRRILFVEATVGLTSLFLASLFLTGCGSTPKTEAAGDTGPPASVQVEPDMDPSNFKVDKPENFPLATAASRMAAPELNVTGVTSPDVSRQVPVISTATGRITEIDAKVGDSVTKDQILFKVRSTDIAGAFSDYRKAVVAEKLAKMTLDRDQILIKDGAIPTSQLEVAQSGEDSAQVDVQTTLSHLQVLGVSDPAHPVDIIEIHAPVSGVITDQEIAIGAAVQSYAPSNPVTGLYPFTISDLSSVWVICDVFENSLAQVHMDEYADVHLNAYPDKLFRARISNIGQILDPTNHTTKVRLELKNQGLMRLGMFVTATFHGEQAQLHAVVPSSAILHLHDRDWVYTPAPDKHFKRLEVVSGPMLPNNMQEVVSGLKPGEQVVTNALVLQSTVEQ
jgi:cobalt-zinc-cadmium efflux system membrane fusion protein